MSGRQITRQKVIIAKIVINICPTDLTGDQRCCPVINDARVNDFAAPTALNNSMSHFRHMQFFSLSIQADTTQPMDMLSVFCIVTPCTSVRVCAYEDLF